MRRLSQIIIFLVGCMSIFAQSPHEDSLKMDCAECHNPNNWKIDFKTLKFNHNVTDFELEGAHNQIDCKSCHQDLKFNNTANQCASCHNDVHSMSVGNDCVRCHTSENWLVDKIPELHEENGFPLIGAHSILSCVDCHTSETELRFDRIGNECISCHQEDYNSTTNPNHVIANYSLDCLECHNPLGSSWNEDIITNHDFFPLTLGHDIQDCNLCHTTGNFTDASPDCVTCHQENYNGTLNPNHQNLNLSTDCMACHTTDIDWMPATFDNHNDFYALNGFHATIADQCVECHNGNYNNTPTDCVDCHQENYDNTTNPNHTTAGYSTDCMNCHSEDAWTPATIDNHDFFPLTLGHDIQDCNLCHTTGNYSDASPDCVTCHQEDYNGTLNPNHQNLNLSTDCMACHTTDIDWMPATFDNHNDFYALNGFHATIADQCVECHNGDYNNTPTDCVGCHQEEYDNTTNPNHTTAGYSTDCMNCHSEDAWTPATIDNHDFFPLTLGHDIQDCNLCHTTGNFTDASPDCVTCHQEDYNGTLNPNHQNLNLSTDCMACHTTDIDWMPATFDNHNDFYALNGFHATIADQCVECHNGNYNNTPTDCVGCHQENYDNTTNPNHTTAGYSTDCMNCHTEDAWTPATIDNHDFFPLTLGHDIQDCNLCHTTGTFSDASPDCVTCHQEDYNSTVNPNHQILNLSTDCMACHTTDLDWMPATFDNHNDFYALNGFHATIADQCVECHNGDYNNTPTDCVGCHQDDYNNTTNPNHTATGYSTDCMNCHTEDAWIPSTIDNHDFFPLTLGHDIQDCNLCHTTGTFSDASPDCVTCHQEDYNGTVNPNHQILNLSTDCMACHTTDLDWMPATFDNHNDFYALNGFHATIADQCVECHNGNYNNTPTDCVDCHQDNYNNTTNPNHTSAQFPTDCVVCHTEDSWEPSTFDHDGMYFPIYTGKHREAWNSCVECHTVSSDYSVFTCFTCHSETIMADKHNLDDIPDYVYENNACFACHPTGEN